MNIGDALKRAQKLVGKGLYQEAAGLLDHLSKKYPGNPRISKAIETLTVKAKEQSNLDTQSPDLERILSSLLNLFNSGKFEKCLSLGGNALTNYPNHFRILLIVGLSYAQLGNFAEAKTKLSDAILVETKNADAYYNFGIVCKQLGEFNEAIEAYRKCVAINPNHQDALNNLGNIHLVQKDFATAEQCYRRLLTLNPKNHLAYLNLGNLFKDQNKPFEACEAYERVIDLEPGNIDALYNLALLLQNQNKLEEAKKRYEEIIARVPNHSNAQNNLGKIYIDTGELDKATRHLDASLKSNPDNTSAQINASIILSERGEYQEAISQLKNVLVKEPKHLDALVHLGNIYLESDNLEKAEYCYTEALNHSDDFVDAINNLGNVYRVKFDLDTAEKHYLKALSINPNYFQSLNNMGILERARGNNKKSLSYYDKSLSISPENYDCLWNKALILLAMGHLNEGVKLYDVRWEAKNFTSEPLRTTKPYWLGSPSPQVLLWAEQGIGDEVMFSSLILDAYKINKKLTVAVDKRLIPLFRRSFPEDILFVPSNHSDIHEFPFEEHMPLGSLMGIVELSDVAFKRRASQFLRADKDRVKKIRDNLQLKPGQRVIGISWKTVNKRSDRLRNCDLVEMLGNLNADNRCFVNLQYGDVDDELRLAEELTGIRVYNSREMSKGQDIDGFAALVCACDHVVSIDNSTVHFAGALGADTHVMLPVGPDWRWGIGRDTSYWYQSVTLYYQSEIGEFGPVLDRVSDRLSV